MSESIFNLINQHDNYSAQMRKRGTSMLSQHNAVYTEVAGQENAINAPMSSEEHHDRPETGFGAPSQRIAARGGGRPDPQDPNEVARRRQHQEMKGGAMASALAPELTYQMKMQQSLGMKNHAVEHKTRLKEQSIINGLLKSQGEVPQTRPAARKPEYSSTRLPGAAATTKGGVRNHVEANKSKTMDFAAKAPTSTNALAKPVKYKQAERPAGRIPKYLVERKIEADVAKMMKEDEERRKNGGPEAMPEEERLETLRELEKQKAMSLKELNTIPPSKLQLSAYQKQARDLEAKLTEIENAIILFSKKVVYITK